MGLFIYGGCKEKKTCSPPGIHFTSYELPPSSFDDFETPGFVGIFRGRFNAIEKAEPEGYAYLSLLLDSLKYTMGQATRWQKGPDTLTLKYLYKNPEHWNHSIDDSTLFPQLVPGDQVTYYRSCGFECAGGLVVRDSLGVQYIYDDSGYGRALDNDATTPFEVRFTSSACANENARYPYLHVVTEQDSVLVLQGDRAIIYANDSAYRVTALHIIEYTINDVTDAPSSYYSFVIQRIGTANFLR